MKVFSGMPTYDNPVKIINIVALQPDGGMSLIKTTVDQACRATGDWQDIHQQSVGLKLPQQCCRKHSQRVSHKENFPLVDSETGPHMRCGDTVMVVDYAACAPSAGVAFCLAKMFQR